MSGLLGMTVGEYRLVEFVGAGGMGEVYRAEHTKIGRVVAIKILTRADPRSDLTARFLNEARIQAGVQHPHIVGLHDFVEYAGRRCIIMEWVDGEMLDRRVERSHWLRLPEALRLFREIVGAVAHLHERGIVHRDIKSNNIKIDKRGSVKLLDFGIARDTRSNKITATGSYVGTMHYSAPEVLSGATADFRSDVWALGVLFYEMLCGRMPFEADSITDFLKTIARPSYDRPSTLNGSCTAEIECLIDRCLEPEPRSRYASAGQLLEALERLDDREARDARWTRLALPSWTAVVRGYWPILAAGTLGVILAVWLLAGARTSIEGDHAGALNNQESGGQGTAKQPGALLRLDSTPRAEILDHGRVIGRTPFRQELPVGGFYELTLRAEGYEDTPIKFKVRETENNYSLVLTPKER